MDNNNPIEIEESSSKIETGPEEIGKIDETEYEEQKSTSEKEPANKSPSPPPTNFAQPTSWENYKICIHNLPRYVDPKELKKFLKRLEFDVKKAYVVRDHAYVCLSDEESVVRSLSVLRNYVWKKSSLRVKRAAPNFDPVLSAAAAKKSKSKSSQPPIDIDNAAADHHHRLSDRSESSSSKILDKRKNAAEEPQEQEKEKEDTKSKEIRLLQAVCPLYDMPYDQQLILKNKESEALLKKIRRDLASVGGESEKTSTPPPQSELLSSILPSPITEGYRNKCEFSIGYDSEGQPTVGFRLTRYKAGSIEIMSPSESCIHVPPMTRRIAAFFQKFIRHQTTSLNLGPYDITNKKGFWSMLTVRQFSSSADTMVIVTVYHQQNNQQEIDETVIEKAKRSLIDLFFPASSSPDLFETEGIRVTSLYFQRLRNSSDPPIYEYLSGAPYVYENVLGLRFRISPGAFFQVNTAACEILYKSVIDLCRLAADCQEDSNGGNSGTDKKEKTLILDLCCGTGTIGIVLSKKLAEKNGGDAKVIGIESCAEAIEDAKINANNNETASNCEYICGKVENVIDEIRHRINKEDYKRVIGILDPPRSGLPGKVISTIRQLESMKSLIYVSCNPNAATKNFVDLTRRSSNRYPGQSFKLASVQPVDLFPHTKHCEWILVFER